MDRFKLNTTTNLWLPEDSKNKLTKTVDSNNLPTGWQFTDVTNDSTETYAVSGQLKSVQQRNGQTTTLQYDASQKLLSATNAFGRRLTFTHNPAGLVSAFTAPGGEVTRFDYDTRNNLTQITWPDNNIKRFHYEDSRHPKALTGVTDELGVRIGTYAYDAQGRVVDTQKAGGADRVQLSYTTAPNGTPRTQVTDFSNGGATSRTYDFTNLGGILRPAAVSAPCPLCGSTAQVTQYDATGNKTREVAHDGTVNFYTYNAKDQETERATYGINYGTATTRPALNLATAVTSTQWHGTLNLITQIAQPGQITSYSYSAKGMLTGLSNVATTDSTGAAKFSAIRTGPVRATGYGYNANSLNTSIVERTDGIETQRWTLAYNASGDLTSITDVTGAQSATLTNDAHGRLTRLAANNGALATFGANSRGQMITANTPSGNVSYVYDARNLINEIRFGDGRWVRYSYSAAQKLIEIRDSTGLVEVIAAGEAEGLDPQRLALRVAQWLADRGDRVAQMLVPQAHAQPQLLLIPVAIVWGLIATAEGQRNNGGSMLGPGAGGAGCCGRSGDPSAPESPSRPTDSWLTRIGVMLSGQSQPGNQSTAPIYDKAGLLVSPQACMPPPGNCDPGKWKRLQDEKDAACGKPYSCKVQNLGWDVIRERAANGRACMAARDRINKTCFAGGDSLHRNLALDALQRVVECEAQLP